MDARPSTPGARPAAPRPSTGRGPLRRAVLPLRRFAARFALVREEVDRREEVLRAEIERLRGELEALDDRLRAAAAPMRTEEERLRSELERMRRENAAILRLVGAAGASGPTPAPPATREGLFRELERGSREEVKSKIAAHVPWFEGCDPVLDLGCGRGEFLELARDRGLRAYGVDLDAEAVEECRSRGLDAREEDLFAHLEAVAEGSIGGVFSSQVVEHLPPELLPRFMWGVARALRARGVALVETPNPATFATHVKSFWRDPTHLRPVPPEALAFAARTAGLVVDRVVQSSPCPEEERLARVDPGAVEPAARPLVVAVNDLVDRLNEVLFGYQDYAMILRRP